MHRRGAHLTSAVQLVTLTLLWVTAASYADGTQDADGDGVCNQDEDRNNNGDPRDDDTDNDGIPDFQDADDDGDGILTRDEDANRDGNPLNDETGLDDDGIPDFLDRFVPLDRDHDGYVDENQGGDDCDDTAFGVNPGVDFDPLYDGADWDCDGWDDYDGDRDGYRNQYSGGEGDDCNDRDPDIHPGATEDLGPIDMDCDGFTDPVGTLVPGGGCDCDSGPSTFPGWWILACLAWCGSARRRA